MARRPRIELAGKYHIVNRGVAQMQIFKDHHKITSLVLQEMLH